MKKEVKKKQVEELKNALASTVVLLDLQNVPTFILQKLRKKTRDVGLTKVYKKTVIQRALKEKGIDVGDPKVSLGVFTTDLSPYKAYWLIKEAARSRRYAKAGDVAQDDIYVEAQETQFQPGPILSDLKAAGLKVKIEKGKIVISERSLVVKKGEEITPKQASVLQKLDIKPFEVEAKVLTIYKNGEEYPVEILDVAPASLGEGIQQALQGSLNLAINASYPTPQSIQFLIQNAARQALNLSIEANYPTPQSIRFLISKSLLQYEALKKVIKDED